MGPIGCSETLVTNYPSTCVKSQQSADLVNVMAEASNHA